MFSIWQLLHQVVMHSFGLRGKEMWSFNSCTIHFYRFFSAMLCLGYSWILHCTMLYGKRHVIYSVSHYFMNYRWRLWQRDISHSVWLILGIHRSLFLPNNDSRCIVDTEHWSDTEPMFLLSFYLFKICKPHCMELQFFDVWLNVRL